MRVSRLVQGGPSANMGDNLAETDGLGGSDHLFRDMPRTCKHKRSYFHNRIEIHVCKNERSIFRNRHGSPDIKIFGFAALV